MEIERAAIIQPGMLEVQTRGGQLSKSTEWTIMQNGQPVCRIERANWKWKFWTYAARIDIGASRIDASGALSGRGTSIQFVDGQGVRVATETDESALEYRGTHFTLSGSWPEKVLDADKREVLTLHWKLQTLDRIDVLQGVPAEFVAIAATACLLFERPTD